MTVYRLAVLKLFTAAIIWGLSFTLIRWTLESFTTSQILFWRFLFAFFIGEIIFFAFNRKNYKKSHSDIKMARNTGLFLGISLLFQIHGLNFTTATNSAFITATYVVMIPFVSYFLFKQKIQKYDVLLGILALGGMVLLLKIFYDSTFSLAQFNFGDVLTFGSAITAAIQITLIGVFAKRCVSPFRFNNYQTFWALIACLPFILYETYSKKLSLWPEHVTPLALVGLVLLILSVSIVAFYLQISAQRKLPTATASMLCLLEAPFSFIFATLLLQEAISPLQSLGAFVIILSAFLSITSSYKSACR
ncbi:MAG: DMT family transporter [Moraxellaceae bacterium]|nr:DMT family transporter [Pseudobdellovibrionaceae bacterium]